MEPSSSQTAGNSSGLLLSIPVELMTNIFCQLPSLSDVIVLASTCHQLRQFWTKNVASIYNEVAPRSIPCIRHARSFLADQGGAALEVPVPSAGDVVCMVRNSCVIEKEILDFQRKIVWTIQSGNFSLEELEKCYGIGASKHPPSLTRTERRRFIRCYYQLWGMMELSPAEWQSRLESLTLKQLYQLCEMTKLARVIRCEESAAAPRKPGKEPKSVDAITQCRSEEWDALGWPIWRHLETTYELVHNRPAPVVWALDLREGAFGFIVVWDHWQLSLKQVVCGRRPIDPSTRPSFEPSFEKQFLWEDSSDEEV